MTESPTALRGEAVVPVAGLAEARKSGKMMIEVQVDQVILSMTMMTEKMKIGNPMAPDRMTMTIEDPWGHVDLMGKIEDLQEHAGLVMKTEGLAEMMMTIEAPQVRDEMAMMIEDLLGPAGKITMMTTRR